MSPGDDRGRPLAEDGPTVEKLTSDHDTTSVAPGSDDRTHDAIEAVVIEPLDEPSARRLTNRIKLLTGSVRESLDKLAGLVVEARDGQAHVALGYKSWTAYVAAEIGDQPLRLDRQDRRELVASLADAGMPTRAIASVVGVHHDTVASDVRASAPVGNPTPDREVTGRDGKTYPVRPRPAADVEPPKVEETEPEETPDEWDGTYSTTHLEVLDLGVAQNEARAIWERWEFGQELLAMRDENGSMPDGFLADVVKATGKSRCELKYRVRLAERYLTDEALLATIERFGSWDALIRGDLKREYGETR